jgi:hypothetical protein
VKNLSLKDNIVLNPYRSRAILLRLNLNWKGAAMRQLRTARQIVLVFGLFTFFWATAPTRAQSAPNQNYGLFNLLDHRSRYGQFWFPEPLRAPEMDVDREFRVDWFHSEKKGLQSDEVRAEIEYNFGLLTVEMEVPYVRDHESGINDAGHAFTQTEDGLSSIELAARYPIFQYVSPKEFFDYTLVAALEVAVPTHTRVSHDTEIVPQLFQLMRFGEHVSLQTSVGYSALIGGNAGGTNTLEYSAVVGYSFEQDDLKLPWINRVVPIFELTGERGLSGEDTGVNRLFGTAGLRLNLDSIGPAQPRLGIGYVFPIDQGARDEMRWGIITSVVFEF